MAGPNDDQLPFSQVPVQQVDDGIDDNSVGYLPGFLRSVAQGVSFGTSDEAIAGAGALLGYNYDDVLASERAKMRSFGEQHPVVSTVGEMAGGLGTLALPGGASLTGMRYLQNAKNAWQAARRSGAVGGAWGAASGYGHGEDGVANRLQNAATAAPISAGLGFGIGGLGYKIGEMAGGVKAAKELAGPGSAYNSIARMLRSDKVEPSDILNNMIPKSRSASQDQIQDIMRARAAGSNQQTIAQGIPSARSATGHISPGTVGAIQSRFDNMNTTPLTLVDRAKMVRPGSGVNTEWRMRAAAATPGDARREAFETLTERQLLQGSRLMDAIQKHGATGTDDSIKAIQEALKIKENNAYRIAESTARPFNLDDTLYQYSSLIDNQLQPGSPVGKALREALELFYDKPPQQGRDWMQGLQQQAKVTINNLERFQGAKTNLDAMIDNSFKDGRATNVTRYLTKLKSDVMDVVGNANPIWRDANDAFTAQASSGAKAGENIGLTLNRRSRDMVKELERFEKMTKHANPEIAAAGQSQIQMMKETLSRAIQDGILNQGETHDLTRRLLMPGAQKLMARVFGSKEAAQIIKVLREEQTGTSTFNKLRGGSQTTPLREEIDDFASPEFITKWYEYANPWKLSEALGSQAAKRLSANKNEAVMKILADTDPVRQFDHLRDVGRVVAGRQQGAVDINSKAVRATSGGASSGDYQRRQDMKNRRGFADGGGIAPYLESNPFGWGNLPPMEEPEGEIKRTLSPEADNIAGQYGYNAGYLMDKVKSIKDAIKSGARAVSGIDMVEKGAEDLARAVQAGDPVAGAGGAAEMGLAALPWTRAGRAAFATMPRAAGTSSLFAAAPVVGSGAISPAVAEESPLQALYEQRSQLARQLQEATARRDAQRPRNRVPTARSDPRFTEAQNEVSGIQSKLDALDAMIREENSKNSPERALEVKEKERQMAEKAKREELDKSFSERHPWASMGMTVGAPIASAALSRYGMNKIADKGTHLLDKLDEAKAAGNLLGVVEKSKQLDNWQRTVPYKQAAAIAVPATLPADARVMGDVIDRYGLPESSKAQNRAEEKLSDVGHYAVDSIPGLVSGAVFSGIGAKTARSAPRGDAKAYGDIYGGKDTAELQKLIEQGANRSAAVQGPLARFQQASALRRNEEQRPGGPGPSRDTETEVLQPASEAPPPALQGLGRSSTAAGSLGSQQLPDARAQDASRRLGEMSGPVGGHGIGDLPLLPRPQGAPQATSASGVIPWGPNHPKYRDRYDAGTVIKGRQVGGYFKKGTPSNPGGSSMGRDVGGDLEAGIEGWISKNPDRGSINRSELEAIVGEVAARHKVDDMAGLMESALKYIGQ